MSNRSLGARVQQKLTQAVASGRLPANAQERAEKLLERISKPVRVGLMGLPGSGKSTILNLLVGAIVVPHTMKFPTLLLTHGETAQTTCTLADGSRTTLPHANGREVAALSPAFVEMQMPLPALGKISLLEVVTPDDPTALQRASQWAAGRIDVALWCTQSFDKTEQSLWAQMPDILKDHAFLMVTKSDFLIANDMLDQTMDKIRHVAGEEFSQILPIATKQAIASRRPNGTVDKALMRSSGGSALISAVLKQVDMGRQTAVDMADILLHQHAELLDAPEEEVAPPPAPAPEPEPVVEAPEPEVAAAAEPEPDPAAPEEVEQAADDANVVTLQPATRTAYESAIAYLTEQGQALTGVIDQMGDDAPSAIMAQAVEHVQWLSDHLNENGDDADAALQLARDTAMDAADLVQLMQMEKRDSAAIEAVSLLVQLKHELQADLAA